MSDKFPGGLITANAPAGFSVAVATTANYLTVTGQPLINVADWTVEFWMYPTQFNNNGGLFGASNGGGTNPKLYFYCSSTNLQLTYYSGGFTTILTNPTPTLNKWTYVSVSRSSSTGNAYLYYDGILQQTATAAAITGITGGFTLFSDGEGSSAGFYGYMSNARVSNVARYTGTNYTTPTQLFPIANTTLLTCQSPTIIDNSGNGYTLASTGTPTVSNFTPFAAYQGFNPALGAAAGGVWTLDEAAYYQNNRQWPIYDPYFNQTTLMLHGNGTNAAQNNTFLDSSANNFTITRNGNATQGTFSPFSQTGWSNYFDGTDDRLTTPSNTVFTLGTGDYTYECWVYHTDISNQQTYFARGSTGNFNGVYFYKANTTNLIGVYYTSQIVTSSVAVVANQWLHLVACRASGTTRLFINGVQVGSGSDTTNLTESIVQVGADADGTNGVKGYMSNARVIKGVALYTSNFTPSTAPLTAITGTSLLTCQNNRFVDNSANNFTLTVAGTPSVQAFSPFVPAYITPTTYSNWFDGTGDYLTAPSSSAFNLSSGDWTIEGWFLLNTNSDDTRLFTVVNSSTDMYGAFVRSGTVRFGQIGVGEAAFGSLSLNTLTHIAFVKTSTSTITCYINGVSTGTTTSYTLPNANCTVYIAASPANYALSTTNGVISNFRLVKGTAVYTANFTPPTAPLTNITNTSLLTCQSSTFIDNSSNNFTITATGNVQPVTSPTPFPAKVDTTTLNSAYSTSLIGGSGYFDGTTDYLSFTDPSNTLDLGGRAASIEAWIYPTSTAGAQHFLVKTGGDFSWNTTSGIEYAIAFDVNKFYFVYNVSGTATFINGATTRSRNQWYHVVVATDASNNIALFVNGVRDGTATNAISKPTNRTLMYVGANSGGTETLTGYISGERFISGSGAYDPTKTVVAFPTTPPTAVSGTQLLLNYTNAGIIDNTAKNVLETVGNAQISTTQSKYGGSSMYCPTTNGNYFVSPPNQQNFLFGTGQFTVEAWIYPLAFTNTASGAFGYGLSGGYVDWNLEISTAGAVLYIDNDAGRFTSSSNLSANVWTHLCVVRTSTAVTMYFNGVSVGTYSTINNISGSSTSARLYVGTGAQQPASRQFVGYIDDLRITKGVARYVTNFTPPTSQLQDQ